MWADQKEKWDTTVMCLGKAIVITRQMFITSGGEPEVICCVSIGRGLGMLRLGYLAVFLSARIVKLYEGGLYKIV